MGFWLSALYQVIIAVVVSKVLAPTIPDAVENFGEGADVKLILNPDFKIPVIYGEQRVGGNIIFYEVTGEDNKYLDIIVLIGEGEIEGINKVYANDETLPMFDAGEGNTLPHNVQVDSTHPLLSQGRATGFHYFGTTNFNTVRTTDWIKVVAPTGETLTFFAGTDFAVGATLADTVDNIVVAANASTNAVLSLATYTAHGNSIAIEYNTVGGDGNYFKVESEIKIATVYHTATECQGITPPCVKVTYLRPKTQLSGGRWLSYMNAFFYNGTTTQPANTQLTAAYPPIPDETTGWTANHRLRGLSYMYVRMHHNTDLFSGSIPKFEFELKGKKVYDSRADDLNGGVGAQRIGDATTWEYSDNPAVCLRDYMLNPLYGKGLDVSALSEVSVVVAANDCDTLRDGLSVTGDPVSYKSYTLGAIVDTSKMVKDNLAYFLQSMNATLPYFDGVYSLNVLKAGNPVVTFDESNIIGGVELGSSNKKNRFNEVWITFPDKQVHFKKGDAPIDNPAYLLADNDQVLSKRIDAPYVTYYPQAMDLAELTMNLSRRGLSTSFTTTMAALEATAGDIVGVTYPTYGWNNKEFRLEKITSTTDGLCDIELSEHDDAFYVLSDQQEQPTPNVSTLVDPRDVLKPILTSVVSDGSTALVSVDGVASARIYIEWDNLDPYPATYLIYAKKSEEEAFVEVGQVNAGNTTAFYIPNVEWSKEYDVGVSVRNGAGYTSPISIATTLVENPVANPIYTYPNVTGIELVGAGTNIGQGNSEEFTGQDIRLQWRLSSDNASFEYGSDESEAAGNVGGIVPFTLSGYKVEIYHNGDNEARQEYLVTDPSFTYTYDKNFDDGEGSPSRSVTFKVWAVGSVSGTGSTGESESPAILSATNPPPLIPSGISLRSTFQNLYLDFTIPVDNDFKGVLVWLGENSGFTRDSSTLITPETGALGNTLIIDKKPDGSVLSAGTEYFVVLQAFDGFGLEGAESVELSTTTIKIDGEFNIAEQSIKTANIGFAQITDAVIGNMAVDKLTSGDFTGQYINILAEGNIRSGQTAFNTGDGFWLGDEDGVAKFSVGNNTNSLTWDGSQLIVTGNITGSNIYGNDITGSRIQGSSFTTTGSYTTTTTATNIIGVFDTTDFPTSGSGWLLDNTNDRDEFSWTGKTATTLTGCSGQLYHPIGALVVPKSKQIIISEDLNEMRFYGDRGDGVVGELANIGIKPEGGDYYIASFGSLNNTNQNNILTQSSTGNAIHAQSVSGDGGWFTSYSGTGLLARSGTGHALEVYTTAVGGSAIYVHTAFGEAITALTGSSICINADSNSNIGVKGSSASSIGVKGESHSSYGGMFSSDDKAPLRLVPSSTSGAPAYSADIGALHVTPLGQLYINLGGTTWQKVGLQT